MLPILPLVTLHYITTKAICKNREEEIEHLFKVPILNINFVVHPKIKATLHPRVSPYIPAPIIIMSFYSIERSVIMLRFGI